ncbi:hypothetical protein ES705_15836 [subsurface metagenome]
MTVTAAGEPPEKSEAPVITSVPLADDGYANKDDEDKITIVRGYSIDGSIVKLYLDGKLIGTTVASKAKSSYDIFEFTDLVIDLGDDGVKTLYATAKEVGLAVSDPSDPYTFILDTELPEIETVMIDGRVVEDEGLVIFLAGTSFKEITAEMSEPVSLMPPDNAGPDYEPVMTLSGTTGETDWTGTWATFEISEDGLTLTIIPATVWLDAWDSENDPADVNTAMEAFYVYREGKYVQSYEANLVKDAAGNGNASGTFTLTYVGLPPES